MKVYILLSLAAIGFATSVESQALAPQETVLSVRRHLERLPYYGCSTTSRLE